MQHCVVAVSAAMPMLPANWRVYTAGFNHTNEPFRRISTTLPLACAR
jgi:hypothetical protein